ncbi:hypothetical protein [Streptosporangium roseum]|uniref:hypothetical protein n=1 Tax=Streptosporangium roseum TaxID=2001 RepID=UPI00157B5DFD|nr:hypothetical protein [Streptosporangium roseum]
MQAQVLALGGLRFRPDSSAKTSQEFHCEAPERGLLDALNEEFDQERPELVEALTYCDMTTSPGGTPLDVDDRLAEIHSRYGPEHLVSRSISNATPCISSAVRAVQAALADGALPDGRDGR